MKRNEWMNEWNGMEWHGMNEWMNEWSEGRKEGMNEWMNEPFIRWKEWMICSELIL